MASSKIIVEEVECIKNEEEVEVINTSEPEPLTLPTNPVWDVHILNICGSTDRVVIRFIGAEYSDQLDLFEHMLEEEFNKGKTQQITEGMICVAHIHGLYHRVKVLSIEERNICCFFMDYADMETIDSEQLRPLDTAINRKLPYQATNVALHGLGHVAQNPTALAVLRTMALGRSRVAVPIMSDDSIGIVLYDTFGDIDININEEIMQQVWNDLRKTRSCRA
ncbi:hypothetical protein CHS0354_023503 [Potamilus streckersoni]|uniref:Tudor domain-containing protein n=1 Tax=Potamilus streckersoni TaxID=2493646 RepID=A0AAE0RV81_9BIVA|nr:hypothetical protein CHS0354_023503 [Potamilus streckersoni]